MEEGIESLLPVKFRWIPFSGFFREVENVSANQRPGRPFCFSDQPEKHELGRGRWNLASYQVALNSVQRFQRRSRKCLGQSEARAAILFFRLAQKNTNLVEGVEILLPGKFRWIPFSGFRGEVENVSANQRLGRHLDFPIGLKNTNLVEGVEILLPVKFHWIPFSGFYREVENVSANQRLGGHLVFPIGPKNTNLVKGFEILLPNKFRWIGFSGFREEVENVFDNQRPGRPSCFSDPPEKHKLVRGLWDLASFQVLLNSVQRF